MDAICIKLFMYINKYSYFFFQMHIPFNSIFYLIIFKYIMRVVSAWVVETMLT